MGHDFLGIGGARAKTQFRLTRQQLLEDGDRIAGHVDGIQRLIRENGIVDFVFIFTAERRLLEKHLVDEDTKGPPIDGPAISLIQENLLPMLAMHSGRIDRSRWTLTSGAMNSGVPQNVLVVAPYHMFSLQRP